MHVLVVEPDGDVAEFLRYVLTRAGYTVTLAAGESSARRALAGARPDLVLANTRLRDGDAWALCQEVRAASDTPFVFLSRTTSEEDAVRGYSAGADLYLTQPIGPRHLVAALAALLRRTAPLPPASADPS